MNRFHYLWGFGLILNPLFLRVSKYPATSQGKDLFFYTMVIILGIFSEPIRSKFKDWYIFVLILIAAFFNAFEFMSMKFWYQFQMVSIGMLLVSVLYKNYDVKYKKDILNVIAIVGIMQALLMISEWLGFNIYDYVFSKLLNPDSYIQEREFKPMGTLYNQMHSATLLALTVPALLRDKWIYGLIPVGFAIILSTSALAVIGLFGIILYYLWNKYDFNKYIPIALFLIVGYYMFTWGVEIPGFFSDNTRFQAWNITMRLIDANSNPYGYGLGHFAEFFGKNFVIRGQDFDQVHNEYIECLYAFGFFGCSLISYWIISILIKCRDNVLLCGIFAVLISSYGSFPLHISSTAFIAISYFIMARIEGENV